MNITNGRNNYKTIVGTRLATSGMRQFNIAWFTDIRANILDETPLASSASKNFGVSSSSISLSVQLTSSEGEHQHKLQKKTTEDLSVDLTEHRRQEHEHVLQSREELEEDNDRL